MPALSIGEAMSVLSAAVVIVTFFIGRVSVSKTSSAKEQRTEDKLDSLCGDTSEIKDGVKEINRKLDDHGERLTKVEQCSTGSTASRRITTCITVSAGQIRS